MVVITGGGVVIDSSDAVDSVVVDESPVKGVEALV